MAFRKEYQRLRTPESVMEIPIIRSQIYPSPKPTNYRKALAARHRQDFMKDVG